MKRFLVTLGLLIALTGIKAVAWVADNGLPSSLLPKTVPDMVGFGLVALLLIAFASCSIWYLIKRSAHGPRKEAVLDSVKHQPSPKDGSS